MRKQTVFTQIACLVMMVGLSLTLTATSRADLVVAFQSFENYGTGDIYTDTFDPATDHDLINNAGEAPVDGIASGSDTIGFDSSYFNTRDDVGLSDGDFVGVTSFTGTVGAYTDGIQGFQIHDADGMMRTDFDEVVITGLGDVTLSLDFFIQDTGYESTDILKIGAIVDGADTTLLELSDTELEERGTWETLTETFNGDSVQLYVEFDTNSSSESLYLDNIAFTAIPEPNTFLLTGLAVGVGLVAVRRRRKLLKQG